MDLATRLLADLVAIPSVNPMGRTVLGPDDLECRVTDYLEDYVRGLGVPYERIPALPGRDNLVAYYQAPHPDQHRTLLWDAHQDTVPVEGMTIPPFTPRIEDQRLFGRGACDIKGGLAAMLAAFTRLVEERPSGSASVILAFTVDEEYTHRGSSRLAESRPRADLAIVAEPTRLDLVTCHKGAVRWEIQTHGVACHSSSPKRGDNAIYRMARVVSALEQLAEGLDRRDPHPVLGPPSLSVGRIAGGISVNVVPDRCEIEVDRRVIPGEVAANVSAETLRFLSDHLDPSDLAAIAFLDPWVNMPALDADGAEPWLAELRTSLIPVLGRVPEMVGVPFGTDAGPLAASGIPCVVFGPGDIAQAHTKDEWVDLGEVRLAAEAYFRIARSLGRGPKAGELLA